MPGFVKETTILHQSRSLFGMRINGITSTIIIVMTVEIFNIQTTFSSETNIRRSKAHHPSGLVQLHGSLVSRNRPVGLLNFENKKTRGQEYIVV